MHREEFANQKMLQDYAEAHDLEYYWEDMKAFAKRVTTLAPGQYKIVEVRTSRGVTRALLFPKAILRSEFEADHPLHETLAIKRERLRAKTAAKERHATERLVKQGLNLALARVGTIRIS